MKKIPEKYRPLAKKVAVLLGTAVAGYAYAQYGPGGKEAVEAVWPYVVDFLGSLLF